ncbi:MAG: hypothetical protein Q3966_04960 [Neisseria sp.]|nr:hypothetical protein [Neisseria sp.]
MATPQTVCLIREPDGATSAYSVETAEYNLYQDGGVWEFLLYLDMRLQPPEGDPDYFAPDHVNIEAAAVLPENALDLHAGRVLEQKEGYDYVRGENLTNLYYFEHGGLENIRVEILAADDNALTLDIRAESYEEPERRIEIPGAVVIRNPKIKRSFT